MGSSESTEQKFEEKTVDSTGHVNNNIVIQEARDTHQQVLLNERMMYATYLLVLFEVIKLSIYMYTQCKGKLKKKYAAAAKKPTNP